jgi:hypothetical protein
LCWNSPCSIIDTVSNLSQRKVQKLGQHKSKAESRERRESVGVSLPSVRMPGSAHGLAGSVVDRPKVVDHQERVELAHSASRERPEDRVAGDVRREQSKDDNDKKRSWRHLSTGKPAPSKVLIDSTILLTSRSVVVLEA